MENDFEIEILDEKKEKKSQAQLPLNFQPVGEIENDDVKVYIRQDVYKALEKYSREDVKNERGTFLLGEVSEELGKLHVIISAYIEAKYTDAAAATLTFTHETWDYVHKEQETKYPKLKILGWQHTHPSYGIFLSSYDLFIHENFFDMPYQIAYVIDPVQNLRGFFQWKQGKVVKLNGYNIFDEVGKPVKIQQSKPKKEAAYAAKRGKGWTAAVILALALGAAGLASSLFMWKKMNRQQEILEQQTQRQLALEQQTQYAGAYASGTERSEGGGGDVYTILDAVTARQDEQQVRLDEQQTAIEALQAALLPNGGTDTDNEEMISHTVKPGDTLYSICAAYQIDFVNNKKEILELNGIENENVIYVGQVLRLPKRLQH